MIINRSGVAIRLSITDLRVMGRATQGVRLINLKDDDTIAAVAKIDVQDEVESIVDGDAVPPSETHVNPEENSAAHEGEVTGETPQE